jgi:hypothetical protein
VKTSEATEGHEPEVAETEAEMVDVEPTRYTFGLFQDESLTLQERVSAFNHYEWKVKTARRQWNEADVKSTCTECGKQHPPPCMAKEQIGSHAVAIKEGRALRAEFSAKNSHPTLPLEEMLDGEVVMAHSSAFGFFAQKAKSALCRLCAKWHPGGQKECTTPFCTKGCNLNHLPWEPCGKAVKRFRDFGLLEGDGEEGEKEEKKKPEPAPSQAKATGGTDTGKFSAFFDHLPDDPNVMGAAASLFSDMVRQKRPAEESAEKLDSTTEKKKKKTAGSGNTCQDTKPPPKGPKGSGGRGGRGGKGGRGASSLIGSIYSAR